MRVRTGFMSCGGPPPAGSIGRVPASGSRPAGLVVCCWLLAGCLGGGSGGEWSGGEWSGGDGGRPTMDAGDEGPQGQRDAHVPADTAGPGADLAATGDLAAPDAGRPEQDAGEQPVDLGREDTGLDLGPAEDSGFPDAGREDAGPVAQPDTGPAGEDGGQIIVPQSCDFAHVAEFPAPLALPAPAAFPLPAWLPAAEDDGDVLDGPPAPIAHAEPRPPYTYRIWPAGTKDAGLVMPGYDDNLPLFERARDWEGGTRCYETPVGALELTEDEAYDLYRSIAEETTGVRVNGSPGVRSVLGLRGTYPGTFSWHGNRPDLFNDTLVLFWQDEAGKQVLEFPAHTDVGARDFGVNSSSSLWPNRRYRYVNGWHRDYNALRIAEQGYRVRDDTNHNGHWDSNRNGWLPPRTADDRDRTGSGHNIHMGSVDAPLGQAHVGGWSAGCQVVPGMANWTAFITHAWTGEGDRVDYFLVDARDIPPRVWQPCQPDGSHECPFLIEGLPYADTRDTSRAGYTEFDVYDCSAAHEGGPELVYELRLDRSGTLDVRVDCVEPVDIDVHLLEGDDHRSCRARDHIGFELAITPGRYLIVADTWVDGGGVTRAGPYTLHVELR